MKNGTLEWIAKAEEDAAAAEWLAEAPTSSPAPIGFHCQQCVEKYFKAILLERDIAVDRTHDLTVLANAAVAGCPQIALALDDLQVLQPFSVQARYSGITVTDADARDALRVFRHLRGVVRRCLDLDAMP